MALGWLLLFASAARGAGPEVVVLPTTGIVDEGMAKYLEDYIASAEERDAAAVVIKLNTPGGSLDLDATTSSGRSSRRRSRSSSGSRRPAASRRAPARSSRSSGEHRPHGARHEHRRRVADQRRRHGHRRDARREGHERRDREDHRRSPSARGRQRRLGGLDRPRTRSPRRPSEAVAAGAVDGIAGDDRGGPRVRRTARRSRSRGADR